MRLFQNTGIYPSYRQRLDGLRANAKSFKAAMELFLADRYGIAHILKPVLDGDESAFFVNGDDEFSQRLWAKENGLSSDSSLANILLAQIEHHRTEVFYNSDPMRYGNDFLRLLPGSVRKTIAWRAAPSLGGNFLDHDVIVNNFPSILESYRAQGARAEFFAPAHDPEMNAYAARRHRPVDVLFIGTYSRHHQSRREMLERVAALQTEINVVMHLDRSKLTRLAETPLGALGPLARHRRSAQIRKVALGPVFGRDLLEAIGGAKIVVNGAIDMAGADRGNMRIWEALGCGAAMVSDAGHYPDGMDPGKHFLTYRSVDEAISHIRELVADDDKRRQLADAGHAMIAGNFSKELQWQRFEEIIE